MYTHYIYIYLYVYISIYIVYRYIHFPSKSSVYALLFVCKPRPTVVLVVLGVVCADGPWLLLFGRLGLRLLRPTRHATTNLEAFEDGHDAAPR